MRYRRHGTRKHVLDPGVDHDFQCLDCTCEDRIGIVPTITGDDDLSGVTPDHRRAMVMRSAIEALEKLPGRGIVTLEERAVLRKLYEGGFAMGHISRAR